jgi:hypothetical protein
MPHAQKRAPTVTGRDGGLAVAYQPPQSDPKRPLLPLRVVLERNGPARSPPRCCPGRTCTACSCS